MNLQINFIITNIILGIGLAMDAFSVSLANGLNEPAMKTKRTTIIAFIFAFFQFLMPLIGWFCVTFIANAFTSFKPFIPTIALLLLSYIGIKMLYDGFKHHEEEKPAVNLKGLIIQGIATSIDALSVGFTIANYKLLESLVACLLIGIVTFIICFIGLVIGKKAGTKLAGKATILGGIILIIIGLQIFISSL